MNREEITEKLINLISQTFQVEEDNLTLETDLVEELGTSSLQMVGFIANIEQEFNVLIPIMAAGEFKTIGDIVDRLENELAGK